MAGRGSKYARKHSVETPVKRYQPLPQDDFDVLDIIYDDISFLDTFESLNTKEQIRIYLVLKKLSDVPLSRVSKLQRSLITESAYKLDQINAWSGLVKEEMLRYPLSLDERHILRMDCYGSIDKRPPHKLSTFYKSASHQLLQKPAGPSAYRLDDAESAPAWQIFRQFANFRKIEPHLKEYLSAQRYNPAMVSVMGVQDFSDLIFKAYQTEENQLKVSFVENDSERNQFVKAMATMYDAPIKEILRRQNWSETAITSLVSAMKDYGNADARKIIITEPYFTQPILDNLESAKIPTESYRVGDPVPQSLVDNLAYADKLPLIAARDEDGQPLRCNHSFEVHHKVAISEGGKMPFLASMNYRNNYLLVDAEFHQYILHLMDKLEVRGEKEAYRCRLEFADPNVAFMSGFSKATQFDVDWTQDPAYRERMTEDKKHIVRYDEMISILDKNRALYGNGKPRLKDAFEDIDKTVEEVRRKYPALVLKYKKHGRTR